MYLSRSTAVDASRHLDGEFVGADGVYYRYTKPRAGDGTLGKLSFASPGGVEFTLVFVEAAPEKTTQPFDLYLDGRLAQSGLHSAAGLIDKLEAPIAAAWRALGAATDKAVHENAAAVKGILDRL